MNSKIILDVGPWKPSHWGPDLSSGAERRGKIFVERFSARSGAP